MLITEITKLIEKPAWAQISLSGRGDLTFTCFDEAKRNGKNPIKLAIETAAQVHGNIIEKVEAVNGYVNLYLDINKILALMQENVKEPVHTVFSEKSVFLEHTSVNPNKAIHIGHIRNSYIGEFLRRSLEKSGSRVLTGNFIEDTGTQVADIIVAFGSLKKTMDTDMKFDIYCSKVYREVNEDYSKNEKLIAFRKDVLQKIEHREKETTEFLKKVVLRILSCQMETLLKQEIKYDVLNMESYILSAGLIKKAVDLLNEKGVLHLSEDEKTKGCLLIKYGDKERVLKRSDGTFLYVAKDIAYALWKHGILDEKIKWIKFMKNSDGSDILLSDASGEAKPLGKYDLSITLVDSEQNDEQEAVKAAVTGIDKSVNYLHYSYEPVALSKNTAEKMGLDVESKFARMSGRKGITVEVDTLLLKLAESILSVAKKNEKETSESDAFKLASNVLRYSLLKVSPSKMVIFDIDDALNIKGDTALYVNYAYARALHILRNIKIPAKEQYVLDEDEKKLIRKCMFWRETIKDSTEKMKANLLCEYLHGICDTFNWFYEKNRVIGSDREKTRAIAVKAFADTVLEISSIIGLFMVDKV